MVKPSESNNPKDWHYLIKDYSLSYHYSASLWNKHKKSQKKNNNGKILAYAATYESQDSSLLKLRLPNSYNQRNALSPLEKAIKEVKTLSELYVGTYHSGTEANKKNFKAEAKDYAVLHLAMHGLLNKKFPMLSSLAFTENRDSIENNFLQAYEISKMELQADLVVLSACETGYGKFQQGEGIVSLARGFIYAGVEALVVSLWSVNDQSTSVIMALFYQALAEGLDKASALRKAKLDYIKENDDIAAHPAFWSPFILVGDEQVIQLTKQNNTTYWPWILAGLGALGLGLALWYKNKKKAA